MNDDEIVLVLLGDADLNGVVNVTDASRIAQYFAGVYEFFVRECVQQLAADADRNGVVNVTDASRIAQYFAGVYEFRWNVAE